MKHVHLILILLSIIFSEGYAQQIVMKPAIILTPQIVQEYNIVHMFLYPLSSKFQSALAKDYYIKKLKETNFPQTIQPVKTEQVPTSFLVTFENESNREIKILSKDMNVPQMQEYHVVKIIYPFAQIPESEPELKANIISQITVDASPRVENDQTDINDQPEKRVDNQNKKIEWKIKNVENLDDFVQENGKKHQLIKTLKTSEIGTATVGIEGDSNPPITLNNQQSEKTPAQKSAQPTQQPSKEVKTLKYNNPTISSEPSSIRHPQQAASNPSSQPSAPQLTKKDYLNQIQRLRYKNHKWTLIIVILILIILFLTFLFMRCLGKRNIDFWQSLNKKLDNYRNNSEVIMDEEQQTIRNKSNELIEQD